MATIEVKTCELPQYGELYLIDEFKKECLSRSLIDSDGFGRFVKDEQMYLHIELYPSMICDMTVSLCDFTHVIWFNK